MKSKLIELTISNPTNLSYINLDKNNKYRGWVQDFGLKEKSTQRRVGLDLSEENDLFLLFVLASAWSKTGPWENAVYFTTYLKLDKDFKISNWLDQNFVEKEIALKNENTEKVANSVIGIVPRKKIAFRKDFYSSVMILAKNWDTIKCKLDKSYESSNWKVFIDYISEIEGLGAGSNKMRIKIPLILRELRCQDIYPNIDGEFCCVPDERVKQAYKAINETMPQDYLKASKFIYQDFKDLYDIPLFAYADFVGAGLI